MNNTNHNASYPSLGDAKAKLNAREVVEIPHNVWNAVIMDALGLSSEPALAGPSSTVHKGPGGYWKVENKEGVMWIEPISETEFNVFKDSITK